MSRSLSRSERKRALAHEDPQPPTLRPVSEGYAYAGPTDRSTLFCRLCGRPADVHPSSLPCYTPEQIRENRANALRALEERYAAFGWDLTSVVASDTV